MNQASTFSVVANGEILDGFELESVVAAFAQLFKVSEEKAKSIVGKQVTLKKEIDETAAKAYKRKLESIGLGISLKEHKPEPVLSLSLEPTQEELESQSVSTGQVGVMVCPKCQLEQPQAEQCSGCGVYMHKVLPAAETEPANVMYKRDYNSAAKPQAEETGIHNFLIAFIAAGVVALGGAFLWKFIAIEFDYELGIIAWAIGGAVGFTAALFGARGQAAASVCAVLALMAIVGGKYLIADSIRLDFIQSMTGEMPAGFDVEIQISPELIEQVSYNYMVFITEGYKSVEDEEDLRRFMVDYYLSEARLPENVSEEEIQVFKEKLEPELIKMKQNQPTFEEWKEEYREEFSRFSTKEIMKDSFKPVDILFLILGVVTAFRLVSNRRHGF